MQTRPIDSHKCFRKSPIFPFLKVNNNLLDYYITTYWKYFSSDMCGPIEKCCCCFPANVGVKFIGMFLILVDISSMIYCTIILQINNKVRLRNSAISVMTTFPLLSVIPRGAGARDAQLHLVRGGGDNRWEKEDIWKYLFIFFLKATPSSSSPT